MAKIWGKREHRRESREYMEERRRQKDTGWFIQYHSKSHSWHRCGKSGILVQGSFPQITLEDLALSLLAALSLGLDSWCKWLQGILPFKVRDTHGLSPEDPISSTLSVPTSNQNIVTSVVLETRVCQVALSLSILFYSLLCPFLILLLSFSSLSPLRLVSLLVEFLNLISPLSQILNYWLASD